MVTKRPARSALRRSASWVVGEVQGARASRADGVYERRKTPAALDATITAYRRAVAAAPLGTETHVRCLTNLAVCLSQRFTALGNPADLDDAIACGRRAYDSTPMLDSTRPLIMANLATHLNRRYDRSHQPADLEASVFFAGASARETSPRKRKDAAARWARFGQYAFEKYRDTGNQADLQAAVDAGRRAIATTPPGDQERARRLAMLSASLLGRFVLTQSQSDLNDARAVATEAVARLPADPDDRAFCLSALAQVQMNQFELSGELPDLERAIETQRRASDSSPAGEPGRAATQADLAMFLVRLFDVTGAPAALAEAQAVVADAVTRADEGSPGRQAMLAMLAIQAMVRWRDYERTGQYATLTAAAAEADHVLAELSPRHFLRQFVLTAAGMIALRRYERARKQADLDRAIAVMREAVETGARRHFLRPGWLSMLGMCLGRRYQRTGDAADLDDAIDLLREAATTSTAYGYAPLWLVNLSSMLRVRFERTSEQADIDEAVQAARRAADLTGAEAAHRPLTLSNLAGCLLSRYRSEFSTRSDIDDAIDAGRAAAEASQPRHTEYPMYLMNLGLAYSVRFDHEGALADAEEGVRYCRTAVDELPDDYGDRGFYLSNLAACLVSLAQETRDEADAAQAVDAAGEALAAAWPDDPDRARYLSIEADALRIRYDRYGALSDLRSAFGDWRAAADLTAAEPGSRLSFARLWGRTAAREGMYEDAVEGFSAAVGILPEVIWHGLTPVTRQRQAARWAGLAPDAASCAVRNGEPELAVRLLEQGRSMLWSQALDLRADLGDLPLAAPELAGRLEAARAILNAPVAPVAPVAPGPPGIGLPGLSADGPPVAVFHSLRPENPRARAGRDYDETLSRIRRLDGFEHYLKPIPYPELATAASGGAAVIVNVSGYGCDAIIVAPGSEHAQLVALPGLTLDTAERHARQLARLLNDGSRDGRPFLDRETDRRELLDILRWLWDVIGAPVLDSLADVLPVQDGPPRIWWCPTGPLVSLPLHAAGHHPRFGSEPGGESVLARSVSSYIPTLTSLARARGFVPAQTVRQLTVATPDLERPGRPELRFVPAELEFLTRHFPPGRDHLQLIGPAATRATTMAGMTDHDWIHLACHAGPLESDDGTVSRGFSLWDGDLTITDLAAQPGRRGGLAFLSACQTATGSDEHRDEALHLAAAIQFIGYSHVIATMWSINDAAAPLAAETFYSTLSQAGQTSASALRAAVIQLRELDPTNPFAWAPYAHYGY